MNCPICETELLYDRDVTAYKCPNENCPVGSYYLDIKDLKIFAEALSAAHAAGQREMRERLAEHLYDNLSTVFPDTNTVIKAIRSFPLTERSET